MVAEAAVTVATEVVASEGVAVSVGATVEATAAAEEEVVVVDLEVATKWEEGWLKSLIL